MKNCLDYEVEHIARMRAYAPECMVLLKKKGDFPLAAPGSIALYGSGARRTIKGGTGSGDVNARFYYTVEQGLQEAGFVITTKSWLDAYDVVAEKAKRQLVEQIKRQAKKEHKMAVLLGMGAVVQEPEYTLKLDGAGDTALYVLARNAGEGNDRKPQAGDIRLTQTEIRDILAANKKYEHFMLVLNVGGVVDLTPVQEVDNILLLSQLGAVTGQALADVVLGKSVPSGKLTATWSAWEDYPTIGSFGDETDTRYNEGVYVGYRYFDSVGQRPQYPFGFGLGYTDFALGKANVALHGTQLTVSVPVTNVGGLSGKEVVQVYVSVPWGKLDQPYQTLAGYAKTGALAPGESETATVTFGLETLASYDTQSAAYILEAGDYIVRVGASSRDTAVAAVVRLAQPVTVRQVTHVGGAPDFEDWKPAAPLAGAVPTETPVLQADPAAFAALQWPAPAKVSPEAKALVAGLSDEELLYLCIGNFQGSGTGNVIGSASTTVAGAAGETYNKVRSVPAVVMADGPAGLRLAQHYTRDAKGAHALGNSLPAGWEDYLSGFSKFLLRLGPKKPKGEVYDQYCTAIPIGTALAQSWNDALCEGCGEVVSEEMVRFGVHLWLAPAFNIHRSPLCGRNFEYCSEDPLISGNVGAAITRGVQKRAGCGVTVKHFCCNNQEYNRNTSNSVVSERALREIYLRGFQICLQKADPCAMMTSYNLLNGVHTSERADLLKDLVRQEWGWNGLIMTDWVIEAMTLKGKHRIAKSAPTLQAGNDLFMPGSSGDHKRALDALKGKDAEFTLTREAAELCAAHVVEAAWRLVGKNA